MFVCAFFTKKKKMEDEIAGCFEDRNSKISD